MLIVAHLHRGDGVDRDCALPEDKGKLQEEQGQTKVSHTQARSWGASQRGSIHSIAAQGQIYRIGPSYMRNGAASRRNGSVMARKMTSSTPWTATPTMRKGSSSSQMNG